MKRKIATSIAAAGLLITAISGFTATRGFAPSSPAPTAASSSSLATQPDVAIPGLDDLIGTLTVVDKLPNVTGYERECTKGKAPLTELNAEWCRSEGVGSMWVGSLRT
ncbi:hypothetical protein [Rhodococcus qingshengii]|uniref:hypothetical protein n=1 Tax=Rhodococcus qingshengii TaxID=334542 RepID=UPI003017E099